MIYYLFLILQLTVIYITTRGVIQSLFVWIMRITRSKSIAAYLLALIYLPGTIVHELSHYIVALVLLLSPRKITLIPQVKSSLDSQPLGLARYATSGYFVKLGSVEYIKKDRLRSFLVGIAPLFAGIASILALVHYVQFPHSSVLVNALLTYLLFSISSSMFSSKKDLEGAWVIILLFIIGYIIAFIINPRVIEDFQNILDSKDVISFVATVNLALLYSAIINVGFRIILK